MPYWGSCGPIYKNKYDFSDAGILDPDCIFFNVHNGSLNMLNDNINRHFTGLLDYDTALTLCMQDNLFHAFGVVCWLFFLQNNV